MMRRKWICIPVILLLGGLLLTGCSGRGNTKDSAAVPEKSTIDKTEEKEGEPAEEEESEETAAVQENAPAYLENLDMFDAGTILNREEINMDSLGYYFQAYEISGDILNRIYGRSYQENENIGLEELRYLKVLHYNFDHEIQVGELIVNAALVEDYFEIFQTLFQNEYEIQSMYLIDDFWTGDGTSSDTASIQENNTSAFCYREITWGGELSNHALGCAIDINPQQNPYVTYYDGQPSWYHENASDYIDRTSGALHVITHDDICYQTFIAHGFSWGGDWENPKDYQHFEKTN